MSYLTRVVVVGYGWYNVVPNKEHHMATIPNDPRFINLTGKTFGRWSVIEYVGKDAYRASRWRCRCECGAEGVVTGKDLKRRDNKSSRSCGCLRVEVSTSRLTTHGLRHTSEYDIWANMLERCHNPKNPSYRDYGDRGIEVCQAWRESFVAFYTDMGPRPSMNHQIDRTDNDGDYKPGNCRWVHRRQQHFNRQNSVRITFQGRTQTITEWALELGIAVGTLRQRYLVLDWSVEKMLTEPVRRRGRHEGGVHPAARG
jgi:hypothetical protein